MQNWMQALAAHYEATRAAYPEDDLLILFDIDGTILDGRYMMLYLLQAYDEHHGTEFFCHRNITDINFNLADLYTGLAALGIDDVHCRAITAWCEKYCWSLSAILEAHRPFPGVLDVIRWFQLQPHTHVGLNTARPEGLRGETLCSLNRLGGEYRVQFSSDLLYMRDSREAGDVIDTKLAGIEFFRAQGYRPFAMVDNQPSILEAVAARDPAGSILLLHAGTLFQQRPQHIPASAVQGNVYDLTELIPKRALPRHIQFAWQGVNSEAALNQFLASNVRWADLGMPGRRFMEAGRVPVRDSTPGSRSQTLLHSALEQLKAAGRGVKVDLQADRAANGRLLKLLHDHGFSGDELWFHADVEHLQENEFRHLAETHPGAIIEVPVDFLAPLIAANSQLAEGILEIGWRTGALTASP